MTIKQAANFPTYMLLGTWQSRHMAQPAPFRLLKGPSVGKRIPPSKGATPGGSDDLAALRQRRAESRRITQAKAERAHDRVQHQARLNRAHGLRDPWGTGFGGDGMPLWDIDQADERAAHYDLHSRTAQDEDGAPALREAFLAYLSRAFNATRGQTTRDEQLADAHAGDPWLTPRQLAALLDVSASTIHRAIHNQYLTAERPGGPHGHYRISIAAVASYLQQAGYTRAAVVRIGQRLQRLLGRKAAAPAN